MKIHVELAARELSLERFSKFENELYQVSIASLKLMVRISDGDLLMPFSPRISRFIEYFVVCEWKYHS